jgi:predicted negative regulator of RcsB-dependent stress response
MSTFDRTEITFGNGTAIVRNDDLDRVLHELAAQNAPAATSVAEEIAALRLARVKVQLMPTEAELEALRAAISSARGPSLARLKALCD